MSGITKKTTDQKAADEKPRLKLESMADLCGESTEPEWLVRNVMTADQPMVIGGPPKSLKTSLALDLAVSLATGRKFLGTFTVPETRNVAVFSGESGRRTIHCWRSTASSCRRRWSGWCGARGTARRCR